VTTTIGKGWARKATKETEKVAGKVVVIEEVNVGTCSWIGSPTVGTFTSLYTNTGRTQNLEEQQGPSDGTASSRFGNLFWQLNVLRRGRNKRGMARKQQRDGIVQAFSALTSSNKNEKAETCPLRGRTSFPEFHNRFFLPTVSDDTQKIGPDSQSHHENEVVALPGAFLPPILSGQRRPVRRNQPASDGDHRFQTVDGHVAGVAQNVQDLLENKPAERQEKKAQNKLSEKSIERRDSHFEELTSSLIWTVDETDEEAIGRARLICLWRIFPSLYESGNMKAQRKAGREAGCSGCFIVEDGNMKRLERVRSL
jgi:hypothetical protein